MQYEDLIKKLKDIKPAPTNPSLLTDNIIYRLDASSPGKHILLLTANNKQWLVFKRVRFIITSAAVLLIGFFLYQQMEISTKLKDLEKQITGSELVYDYHDLRKTGHLNALILNAGITAIKDTTDLETLQISRRTLNFLHGRIEELEKENLSIKEKLQKYYNDSTQVNQ